MTTVTLRAQYSTWVQQDHPTANWFRKTGYMSLYGKSGRSNFGIVWFANPIPRTGGNVLRATLTVKTRRINGSGASQMTVQLCDVWSAHFGSVNWNTRPSGKLAQASLSKSNPLPDNQTWQFDVTSQMQAIANGEPFYGFVLTTQSQHQILVQGNMSAALDPSLSVEWIENPVPPEDLAPSTGQAVGSGSPVLTWRYRDYVGGDVLAAAQVRTGTSETTVSSAPSWDSGEVATTVPQLDLSTVSGWTAPAADTLVWWQVRCKDSSGVWSGWSDPVSWQWHARPVVTLVQPDGGTFSDPTPPIQWSVSGDMPQSRWLAAVQTLQGSRWVTVASSGVVVSSETSWTPDVGLATAGRVRIIVQAWDDRAREATPGYATYGSVVSEFDFAPSDTVESVSNLTVADMAPMPQAVLRFTRSEVPDRIDVYRDDVLLTRHEGLDFLVSGDDYEVTDAACPNGRHTWKVWAIVNGVASKSSAVTATIRHAPTWLIDPETQERVCLAGDTDHDMTMPETVQEFSPIAGGRKVKITTAQYGYEGTLTGQLVPWQGMPETETPRLWRERLMAWKADPGHNLTLLIEDLDFHVGITDVNTTSIPGQAGQMFNVSVKFHQLDRFIFGADSILEARA
jgi:hypothetical protein